MQKQFTQFSENLNSFEETKTLIDSYFSTIVSDFNGKGELFKAILNNSVSITTESLLGAGVSNDIINPISDYLSKSVTSGSNLTELIQDLQSLLVIALETKMTNQTQSFLLVHRGWIGQRTKHG